MDEYIKDNSICSFEDNVKKKIKNDKIKLERKLNAQEEWKRMQEMAKKNN
jgi:hypothetical protein